MVLFYLYLITQELMLGSTILIFSSGLLGSAVGRGAISVLSLSNERLLTHANGIETNTLICFLPFGNRFPFITCLFFFHKIVLHFRRLLT